MHQRFRSFLNHNYTLRIKYYKSERLHQEWFLYLTTSGNCWYETVPRGKEQFDLRCDVFGVPSERHIHFPGFYSLISKRLQKLQFGSLSISAPHYQYLSHTFTS